MESSDTLRDEVIETLRGRRLSVEPVQGDQGPRLEVTQGRGLMARRASLDLAPLASWLEDRPPHQRARHIAGYASGVKGVMLEPARSKASSWSFNETAGRLLPNIEVASFGLGVRAASADAEGGGDAFTLPFHDDLIVAYYIQLDMGLRVLTRPQVEAWGATEDRVVTAARSLLFHKTRDAAWRPLEGHPSVQRISVGDSYDAARALVLADAFFSEVDDGFHLALPSQDELLLVTSEDEAHIEALKAATHDAYSRSDYPLTTALFSLEKGHPVPAEH